MFWKKKKKPAEVGAIQPLFVYEDDPLNKREYVRVAPLPHQPVNVNLGGRIGRLVNISAGGMAVRCPFWEPGEDVRFALNLPGEIVIVRGVCHVHHVSDDDVRHCEYRDLTNQMIDAVHHYVLTAQKEQIRLEKARLPRPPELPPVEPPEDL